MPFPFQRFQLAPRHECTTHSRGPRPPWAKSSLGLRNGEMEGHEIEGDSGLARHNWCVSCSLGLTLGRWALEVGARYWTQTARFGKVDLDSNRIKFLWIFSSKFPRGRLAVARQGLRLGPSRHIRHSEAKALRRSEFGQKNCKWQLQKARKSYQMHQHEHETFPSSPRDQLQIHQLASRHS
ncbi:hypothetical protein EMPG_12094 [Blastomyces silverae]|uniref:Uncharacterized protein n=1 Tax=Blastomyces silverae TaxID=2060906 RepID=A0A0H1BPJ2_9EURO|nr:hypothetical protein EMPG_12094 [Blastomyces silverae]